MNLTKNIIRNITYPLWLLKDRNIGILQYLDAFDSLLDIDSNELLERQFRNLKSILIEANRNTRYYQKIFQEYDFNPDQINDFSDMVKLPLLTKKIVRENFIELVNNRFQESELTKVSTGGSTGTPMTFYRNKLCLYKRKGQEYFFDKQLDYRIGDKIGYFVSSSHFSGADTRNIDKIRNSTSERMLKFDPYDINDTYMELFTDKFRKFKPEFIKCFPNSLAIYADFLSSRNIYFDDIKAITCTGETLFQQQKELFNKTFGAEVYEKYATHECGVIASECKQKSGLHYFCEGIHIEILDKNGSNLPSTNLGRIVITDLFNYGFPLIRYDIGDMGILSSNKSCECGSSLPKLKKILGRDRDILVDENDNLKPGYLFVEIINNLSLNAQFQIIQNEDKSISVNIKKSSSEDINTTQLFDAYRAILGDSIPINFNYVVEIERDPSGKYSYVKSKYKRQ